MMLPRLNAWWSMSFNGREYPRVFLNTVGTLLILPIGACLVLWLASLATGGPDATWSLGAAFITIVLLNTITITTTHLPDSKRMYMLRTLGLAACVFLLGAVMQLRLPALVVCVAVLLMLIMVFSSRLMERSIYAMWYRPKPRHEGLLALGVCLLGVGFWLLGLQLPWFPPAAVAVLCMVQRTRIWYIPRLDIPLSVGQHMSIWARKARREPPVLLWGSMLTYSHAWSEGIPCAAINATCARLDVDSLLAYFHYFPVHNGAYLQPTQDLTRSIVARLQELDERAILIFDMQSNDLPAAAQTLKDVRSNKIVQDESWELPDL